MFKGELLADADRASFLVNAHRTALKVAQSDSQDGTARSRGSVLSVQGEELEVSAVNLKSSIRLLVWWSVSATGRTHLKTETKKNIASRLYPATYSRRAIELNSGSNPLSLSVPEKRGRRK